MTDSVLLTTGLLLCALGVAMIGYAYRLFLNWWREHA
jgi:cell division protein FtsL